ncbi:glycosyltransferase family 2 protein [Pseudoduganella violacea]|uniref:Glycosyltransferase involved in cell wall biosynthesis n=1 Tax=Pseudoduganella violacea TaxID=1715466 RepID=A0A7W5BAM0_9BURK|nr:glycosyltransferase [Pseudoduganella violacea]MBB3119608.1 glycosyltransferase involved in cell wall biosynthesis [Pseudoduganella violacea]
MPAISVVMPAYNAAAFLQEAIDSILAQTFTDFELIVINDGSTDATVSLLAQQSDPRVRVVDNGVNRGLIYTRNLGIDLATAPFIAFLDSDDLAFPQRLQRQYDYLQQHPEVDAVGCWSQPIDAEGRPRPYAWRLPGDSDFVKATLLFRAYISTPAFFVRTEVMRALRFSPEHDLAEDYDMYTRGVQHYRFVNLPEVLIAIRIHGNNITRLKKDRLAQNMNAISAKLLRRLEIEASEDELRLHRYIEWLDEAPAQVLQRSRAWLARIVAANQRCGLYEARALRHAVAERWFAVCNANSHAGLGVLLAWLRGPHSWGGVLGPRDYLKLCAKTLLGSLRRRG